MAKGINANSTNKYAPDRWPIRTKGALFEILSHAPFNFWGKHYKGLFRNVYFTNFSQRKPVMCYHLNRLINTI